MNSKPRLLILNASCLDVLDSERSWIESLGFELMADRAYISLDVPGTLKLLQNCQAVILPAHHRMMPNDQQMQQCPRLLVCSIAASGFEWLDVQAATRHGIVVTYAPGGDGAEVVADMAWGLMLAVARQIPYHNQLLCNGDATRGIGAGVYGKTLGIIGLGQIGRATARRAAGFNVKVLATDPLADNATASRLNVTLVSMDELLAASDFVSLHVRLTTETRNLIGAAELKKMKPSAFLINTARRELVHEASLAAAILGKQIAGAGLDDPPGPDATKLLGQPNVVFTPHLGNRAIEGMRGVFHTAVENAAAVLRGQQPALTVNPEVYLSQGDRM